MAKLIYAAIASLDGYINDERGDFQWAAPDEELHTFVNDQERPIGTHLYGRRMYEVMRFWESAPIDDEPDAMRDFAELWRALDKVVFSTTLEEVTTGRTRLERTFDPDVVRALKHDAARDLSIGGPTLAAHAFAAGLIDEVHLYLHPVVIGGGTFALPRGQRIDLELLDEHRFASGAIHLHHAVRH